jgi:hypothetical protein
MWLMLQSDKGLSSAGLAKILGVSQPVAWRIGHALRLMAAREKMHDSTAEIDYFHLGGSPETGSRTLFDMPVGSQIPVSLRLTLRCSC